MDNVSPVCDKAGACYYDENLNLIISYYVMIST